MSKLTILLLEDDDDLREAVAEELEEAGYEVIGVAGGVEAVAAVAETTFDLVVVDVRMKGISGLEALAKMREFQQDLPCIVVTGYACEEDAIRAARLGVRGYLRKPFEMAELLAKIALVERELESRQEEEAREQQFAEVLHWTVKHLSQDERGPDFEKAVSTSGVLADHLSLSPYESRLAQYLAALRMLKLEPPPSMQLLYEASFEFWDGSGPLGLEGEKTPLLSRIVCLALRTDEDDEKFDPALVGFLERIDQSSSRSAWRTRRTLAGLGQALLSTGDSKGATKAFKAVLEDSSEGVEAVTALLGLAQTTGSYEYSQRAVETASRLGPTVSARTGLEVALLVQTVHPKVSRKLLLRNKQIDSTLLESKLADIVLWQPGEEIPLEALNHVLEQRNAWAIAQYSRWLTPILLTFLVQGDFDRSSIHRFLQTHPNSVRQALLENKIPASARKILAKSASKLNLSEPTLQLLRNDPDSRVRDLLSDHTHKPQPTLPTLRIYTLGRFEAFIGDQRIDGAAWKGKQGPLILAYILSKNGSVGADTIIDAFWPDRYEKGKRGLYNALSLYRRILKSEECENSDWVLRQGTQIFLNPERDIWNDVSRSAELQQVILRQDDVQSVVVAGRELLRLFRGPYLENCYMDWAVAERNAVEKRFVESLTRASELALEGDALQDALEFSLQVCNFDSCHQVGHILAMQAYGRLGRSEQAVRLYRDLERALKLEFEAEPSIEALKTFHEVQLL